MIFLTQRISEAMLTGFIIGTIFGILLLLLLAFVWMRISDDE